MPPPRPATALIEARHAGWRASPRELKPMTRKDKRHKTDPDKKRTDSATDFTSSYEVEETAPQMWAEPYITIDGRFRLISNPMGEWIEIDSPVEVEP